ncbi:hypothetical protein Droror1_Dr00009794 [Drosera rotundifolia]
MAAWPASATKRHHFTTNMKHVEAAQRNQHGVKLRIPCTRNKQSGNEANLQVKNPAARASRSVLVYPTKEDLLDDGRTKGEKRGELSCECYCIRRTFRSLLSQYIKKKIASPY